MANLTFLLDEHVPGAIDAALLRRNIDVTTVQRLELRGQPDVVVTFDDDYLKLHHAGQEHAGIAFWNGSPNAFGAIVRALVAAMERRTPEQMRNWVEYL